MATSLLLEGDDLEQLLLRAQREGGPKARIVRAEKIRHGGVMGFFARETFEVAIEIPDDDEAPGATAPAPTDHGSSGRAPVEALLDRMRDRLVDTSELTPRGDHASLSDAAGESTDEPTDDTAGDTAQEPAVAAEEESRPAFAPFGEVFQAAARSFGVDVDSRTEAAVEESSIVETQAGPAVAPAVAEDLATDDEPDDRTDDASTAETTDIEGTDELDDSADTADTAETAEAVEGLDITASSDDEPDNQPDPDEPGETAVDAISDEEPIPPVEPGADPGAALIADEVDHVVTSVTGRALAAPMPSAEILTVPANGLVIVEDSPVRRRIEARRRRAPLAGPDRREISPRPTPATPHGLLDPVLAVERSASRSVAGQPLADPQDLTFSVPLQRRRPRTSAAAAAKAPSADLVDTGSSPLPTSTLEWEREVSVVARTAACAAVHATMHGGGVSAPSRAARFALVETRATDPLTDPLTDPFTGSIDELPAALLGDELFRQQSEPNAARPLPTLPALPAWPAWRPGRHSSERGTAQGSGHWAVLPTPSLMVTGFPDAGSDNDPASDDNSTGVRPEFTALLERLRSASGLAEGDEGRHAAVEWSAAADDEPLIPEPIAAEVAWSVVEQLEMLDDPAGDTRSEDPGDHHDPLAALPVETGQALVESIRRQAQAAIDEVFSAAGLADEAERMQRAAGTIPLPRRTTVGDAEPDAAEPDAAEPDAAEPALAPTEGLHHTGDRRLAGDRAVLRGLGVPETWVQRLRGGDRYADVWQALEELPVPDIDPEAAVVAVVGAPAVVRLEAHRVAVDLAEADDPRPVVLVPAGADLDLPAQVGRHPRCVVAIESDGTGDPSQVLESLGRIAAQAVIVVLDATLGLAEARSWLFSLGHVDAVALDGVLAAVQPAVMLQLGVPITRLDGIPIDRLTWTALLCAQLEGADPA